MIRFLLIVLFLALFFLVSIAIYPMLYIVGIFNMDKRNRTSHKIVSWAFKCITLLAGTKVDVIGLHRVPKDKAVLFVGNHRGFFDIVLNYAILPPCMGFVSKKEMKKVPFISWWMVFVNCLFLDRENVKEGMKTILAGVEKLKSGISMFIFPEGTRSRGDEGMLEFKEGSMKMAEKAGCPIVPVAISNTSACFEDSFPKVKKAHVIIEYCEPININEMSKEDRKHMGAYTRNIIQETVDKNAALI